MQTYVCCQNGFWALSRALVFASLVLCATAYPNLFVNDFAQGCTDHPKQGFGAHGAPVQDTSASFSLTPMTTGSTDTPAPVNTVCPGQTYQVFIAYEGRPRGTLLTASVGALKASKDTACPGRSVGMIPARVYQDQLEVPCDAAAGSTLELKVTSASSAADSYHQATYTVSSLDKCPASTCGQSPASTTPAPAAAQSTATTPTTSRKAAPAAPAAAAPANAKASVQPAAAGDKASQPPAPSGLSILTQMLAFTNTTEGNSNSTAPQLRVTAAAGAPAAAPTAARSAATPRKAGGDFPMLDQITAAVAQLQQQLQKTASKARTANANPVARSASGQLGSTGGNGAAAIANAPFVSGLIRAMEDAAQNATQNVTQGLNTTELLSQLFPGTILRNANARNTSSSSRTQPKSNNSNATANSFSFSVPAGVSNQWQAFLQRVQGAMANVRQRVQATSGSTLPANGVQATTKPSGL